jgi:SAF domain
MSGSDPGLDFGTVFHPEPEPARNSPVRATAQGQPQGQLRGLPRRRRPAMIALAAALIGAGILASAALYNRENHQVSVVMVTAPVPVGQVITSADVGTTSIAAGPGLQTIPSRQMSQVVGLVAATSLRPGTLLAPSEVTSKLAPGPGQDLVPVAIKPSGLPASGLTPGDQVLVVATPAASGGAGAAPVLAQPVPAVVEAVNAVTDQNGFDVVDLLVTSGSGPAVAEQAATGQIALVVTHRAGP